MAREFLRWTPELTWGTFDSTSTTAQIIQLDQNNAFTMRPSPVSWQIRSAGGYSRRVQTGSSKTSLQGGLNILCYGSQMATLMPAINATSANVLKSATIDHCIVMEDNSSTKVYRRYLGCMVNQAVFSASESNQLMRCNIQLTAKQPATITATDFPEPAASAYPYDAPYVFEMAAGGLTIGSSRVEFEEFNITIKNVLDPRFMAGQYLSRLKYCGRDVDWTTRFPYITSLDRADYEAVTPVAASITFTNGTHSLAFNFNANNYKMKADDDLAMDKVYLQSIEGSCFFDPTAGTPNDLTVTVS
ncbi:phage tail tube protein [Singulisphaera acidiphila]|uniref:Uncharacterized protein n=1 Tax=Singulisphaera acidiphila (strain ATCC BAA-1392 / DSM 18658 / VKM B-2454 / MOB10) TaxID=886293 RepID=L0DGK1_SINAD|nr:phage tail tube protein [Singulisphaera acidiphila]AGA28382.1 hypothetical protein Sinac_4175 [Singulisphaera acidiphila DSM 18658]